MRKKRSTENRLQNNLRELCLPRIRESYAEEADRARKESWDHEKYLAELVELECIHRKNRRTERLLKRSKLPLEKDIDGFDLERLPMKQQQQVKALLSGAFLDHRENILAFGNPGSGKTHLLCAISQHLIREQGRTVFFSPCSLLVQELLLAKQELKLPKMLKKLSRFEAIIIDDIGYVQQNREEMEILFTLLAERYERGTVMLTSNLPFSKWERIFKDPMVTAAAIDRLVHHSVILELNLPSFRMDAAKKRKSAKATKGKK